MLVYILIKKDKYLKEIKTLSCSSIDMIKNNKSFFSKRYNAEEEDLVITDKKVNDIVLEELGIEIQEGFKLDGNIVKEMNTQEKIDNGIIKLKENQILIDGEIYTLKVTEKIINNIVVEKTYQEKYNDGLITKEEYNEEVRKEREIEYSKTDDMYNKLTIRYNLKELTEQEYQEGLEKIKKIKEEIKEKLKYID